MIDTARMHTDGPAGREKSICDQIEARAEEPALSCDDDQLIEGASAKWRASE
jgi:hypothetical protein